MCVSFSYLDLYGIFINKTDQGIFSQFESDSSGEDFRVTTNKKTEEI